MQISDPHEIEPALAFFRRHFDRELDVTMSVFEGLVQHERYRVAEVGDLGSSRVLLIAGSRELELDLHHYSFATVSPDQKKLEIGRLMAADLMIRLTASELS